MLVSFTSNPPSRPPTTTLKPPSHAAKSASVHCFFAAVPVDASAALRLRPRGAISLRLRGADARDGALRGRGQGRGRRDTVVLAPAPSLLGNVRSCKADTVGVVVSDERREWHRSHRERRPLTTTSYIKFQSILSCSSYKWKQVVNVCFGY